MKTLEHLRELAYRTYTGTSFSPEKRAESVINDYSQELDEDLSTITGRNNYKEKYIGYLTAWLLAKSNCLSTMIAGPSNFPVRRAEKANKREQNKYVEFREWRENYFKSVEKTQRKQAIVDAGGKLEVAKNKLSELESLQEKMKRINKAYKAFQKNEKSIIDSDLIEEEKQMVINWVAKDWSTQQPYMPFSLTNNNSKIKNTKLRVAELEKKEDNKTTENKEMSFKGGIISYDYKLDRITIKNDSKPSKEIIQEYKSHGFKWSPHYTVWMRKITPNAKYVTEKLLLPKLVA